MPTSDLHNRWYIGVRQAVPQRRIHHSPTQGQNWPEQSCRIAQRAATKGRLDQNQNRKNRRNH